MEYGPVKKTGEYILGKDSFYLKHVDTGCTLVSESSYNYNNQNCPRCPILSHMEASCTTGIKQKLALWSIDSGFFFPLREDDPANNQTQSDDEEHINEDL